MPKTKEKEINFIFFYKLGDNYKNATTFCKDMQSELMHHHDIPNFHTHAQKYPAAFQNYMTYALTSFVCLLASILLPTVILLTNPITGRIAGLAFLSAAACVFLSILVLMIPFLNRDQKLFKSPIEQIDQLIYQDVKPESILFGHSFGGAVASEVSRHFANSDVKLGGIVFTSNFGPFHTVTEHFPMPQTKILSILPSFLLKRILKAFH